MENLNQDIKLQKQQLDSAKENYLRLKREITLWQEERGPFWADRLLPSTSSPLFTLESLPVEAVIELWQRLTKSAGQEVAPEVLQSLWEEFKADKSVPEHTLHSYLHLALSGVAQLFRQKLALEDTDEDQPFGPCPVCGEEGAIATLVPPVGKRYLHCVVCGHDRPVKASGCIRCGSEQADRQTYLHAEEFPGVEVVACADCGGYFKQMDLRELMAEDLVWEDIRTLPLNYAAEQWLAKLAELKGKIQ